MVNSKVRVGMMEKESQFYKRIKRYRVDPSSSNISNPVPDYYGEKIGSVGGYRQWLKDQRAFNKRRQVPV
ncbi:MAG: TIM23 complex component [Caeruleum heppii]|nr:MAG: TIM23 complex component [Caeruleum heppii]